MAFHDFDQARGIHEALMTIFARELGGVSNPKTFDLVSKLCDAAVDAVDDVDCRVAIRGVKSLAALLYSHDGHKGVEAGPLRGPEAVRFRILNGLTNFRGRLDVLQSTPSFPEMPAIAKNRLSVLVVEDNRDAADTLKKLLEICGYAVVVAYTGRDALEAAKELRPDVVLCDIGLPDTDGFTLAAALREYPALQSARLIAVTAHGTDSDLIRSKKAGFEKHLVKPVDPQTLLEDLAGARSEKQESQGRGLAH
jgi:CheY-like chemotaxis protein